MTRWYEDLTLDEPFDLGAHTFGHEEMVAFARRYDPQYFHLDDDAAAASHFGTIVACGWHTAAVGHRKMVDALESEAERLRGLGQEPGVSGPSPGVNALSFKVPVRAGDTLRYTLTVKSKRPSNSIPGWGLLMSRIEAVNQRDELAYTADLVGFSKLRDYRMPWRLRVLTALARLPLVGPRLARRQGG